MAKKKKLAPTLLRLPDAEVINLPPARRLVYDYLTTGMTLTSLVGIGNLGSGSISSRVAELRNKHSLKVESEFKKDHNGRRYKAYFIPSA